MKLLPRNNKRKECYVVIQCAIPNLIDFLYKITYFVCAALKI